MKIRLMFEPKPGVVCNVNEMFRCYAENYLSDYPEFEWGGYIVMDASNYKYSKSAANEPMYQFLATDATDVLLKQIQDYIFKNPMHGYHKHISVGYPDSNEELIKEKGTPYTRGEGI
jgi:hypothetical protein